MNHELAYKKRLAVTRQNDANHDTLMTEIAKRGGKTIAQLRHMRMADKDAFITRYIKDTDK